MIETQKNCADILLLKAFDTSKVRISKLRRSTSNIIIMLRCVKGYDVLRRLTTFYLYRGKIVEKQQREAMA